MSGTPPTITVNTPSGKTYADPQTNIPTEFVPAGVLTDAGKWVPLRGLPDGSVVVANEGETGVPHFDDAEATITPGVDQTLIDNTVPVGVARYISQVIVSTRITGVFTVQANGEIIGSGRTGPGCVSIMPFNPPRPLAAGVEYKVIFTSRLNAPAVSVECYVQADDMAV